MVCSAFAWKKIVAFTHQTPLSGYKEELMFIRSTGLGRTLLTGKVARIISTTIVPSTLEPPKGGTQEPMRILMEVEITNPVHWTIRAFVDPHDLREMLKRILTSPRLMLNCLRLLFSKAPNYDTQVKPEADAAPGANILVTLPGAGAVPKVGIEQMPKGPSAIPMRKR
jgi:hypothetical protein